MFVSCAIDVYHYRFPENFFPRKLGAHTGEANDDYFTSGAAFGRRNTSSFHSFSVTAHRRVKILRVKRFSNDRVRAILKCLLKFQCTLRKNLHTDKFLCKKFHLMKKSSFQTYI